MLNPKMHQFLLVAEEAAPRMPGRGIFILVLKFVPVLQVRIVYTHLRAHFRELADDDLRAAVPRVGDVLPVARPAQQHIGPGNVAAHIAERIPRQRRHVQAAGVVDVDGRRGYLEDVVLEA